MPENILEDIQPLEELAAPVGDLGVAVKSDFVAQIGLLDHQLAEGRIGQSMCFAFPAMTGQQAPIILHATENTGGHLEANAVERLEHSGVIPGLGVIGIVGDNQQRPGHGSGLVACII